MGETSEKAASRCDVSRAEETGCGGKAELAAELCGGQKHELLKLGVSWFGFFFLKSFKHKKKLTL